ncbi:MAG TPA: fumarylacetoacetate hydrolase family protein [Candidatus Saccharimonadales bacterium]|nr:fumarylacetoacetate hydrolase family protein [Candidatus Saccharimonadales bacterium]
MDSDSLERAATMLREARLGHRPMRPLPAALRPADEPEAYRLQAVLNRQLSELGAGGLAGHKIGCTTPVMQAFLDIPNPCAGEIFESTVHLGHGRLRTADYLRAGVECEIAVRLGRDLAQPPARGFDRASVAPAVAACTAAMEIVDDRYADYRTLGTPTLIADDFFNAGCVLGDSVAAWSGLDLTALRGRMTINGAVVGEGRGGDILGHPFDALAWLAGNLVDRGTPLRAGSFVMLGSVVATRWVSAGDEVEIEVDGLGRATASFS